MPAAESRRGKQPPHGKDPSHSIVRFPLNILPSARLCQRSNELSADSFGCRPVMHACVCKRVVGDGQFFKKKMSTKKPPESRGGSVDERKRDNEGTAGSAAGLTEVHFEVAQVDLGIALAIFERLFVHFRPPFVFRLQGARLACSLVLPLAVDAAIRIRQGIQSRLGDLAAAVFATAVNATGNSLQGVLDLPQFTAFDLDKLRTDLVVRTNPQPRRHYRRLR